MSQLHEFASKSEELSYLLRLVEAQMGLLSESSYELYRGRKEGLTVAQCRYNLFGLRGTKVVANFEQHGKNCERIAVLMREIESEESSAEVPASK
jgi:hypothetical protein